ncbi:MAG: NHL repeat-containing protein [bacterium]
MRRAPLLILLGALALAAGMSRSARPAEDQEIPPRTAQIVRVEPGHETSLVFPTFLHTWGMQRAGPTHLRIYSRGQTRFDDPQGVAVTVLDVWNDPEDDGDDDEVTVYGVNSGRGEIIYNSSMYSLGRYGSKGSGQGQFLEPHGIDADPAGNVVVADTGNDRVALLYNDGRVLSHRAYLGEEGEAVLDRPYDAVLVEDEGVWVSDSGNGRLVYFDMEGSVRRTVGLDTVMAHPGAIALTHPRQSWSYFRESALFVASREGDQILRLDREGGVTARVTAGSLGQRSLKARYLATDFYSNLWVTDAATDRVLKFDRDLRFLTAFGGRGRGDRQFQDVRGIGIWRRFGQTFIAEERGAQYYWVGADARDVTAVQQGTDLQLGLFLTEFAYLTVRVRYEGGGRQEVLRRSFQRPGRGCVGVDLRSDRPLRWVEVVVEPTYSSYTYREKVFTLRFNAPESR